MWSRWSVSFPVRWFLVVNSGSSRQEGEEKHVWLIVPLMTAGSQHVRHVAFGSNVSVVIQVTSQLRSWAAATNRFYHKEQKTGLRSVFFDQSTKQRFHGCLKIPPIAATSAALYFLLISGHLWFASSAYICKHVVCAQFILFLLRTGTKKFNVCRWRVAFSFLPSVQQLIQIVPQPGSFFSVHSYLINPIWGPVFVLFLRLVLCCVCSEHIESLARTMGALI